MVAERMSSQCVCNMSQESRADLQLAQIYTIAKIKKEDFSEEYSKIGVVT